MNIVWPASITAAWLEAITLIRFEAITLIRFELTEEVALFLETECLSEEVDAFWANVEAIRDDPIDNSQPFLGRTNRPRLLRYFRFGGCIALFEYHWTGEEDTDLIRVVGCTRKEIKPNP